MWKGTVQSLWLDLFLPCSKPASGRGWDQRWWGHCFAVQFLHIIGIPEAKSVPREQNMTCIVLPLSPMQWKEQIIPKKKEKKKKQKGKSSKKEKVIIACQLVGRPILI